MQITITARHFNLTNAIRDHIESSCEKLGKYFEHIITVSFVLSLENNRNKAEMTLHIPKNLMKSEAEEKNMYVSIDTAIDKMEQQIKKIKGKWSNRHKKSLRDSTSYVYADLINKSEGKKIKIKRIPADVMSVDEAIVSFEAHDVPYYVFKNMETDKVNVLVRKDSEHYKLIQP